MTMEYKGRFGIRRNHSMQDGFIKPSESPLLQKQLHHPPQLHHQHTFSTPPLTSKTVGNSTGSNRMIQRRLSGNHVISTTSTSYVEPLKMSDPPSPMASPKTPKHKTKCHVAMLKGRDDDTDKDSDDSSIPSIDALERQLLPSSAERTRKRRQRRQELEPQQPQQQYLSNASPISVGSSSSAQRRKNRTPRRMLKEGQIVPSASNEIPQRGLLRQRSGSRSRRKGRSLSVSSINSTASSATMDTTIDADNNHRHLDPEIAMRGSSTLDHKHTNKNTSIPPPPLSSPPHEYRKSKKKHHHSSDGDSDEDNSSITDESTYPFCCWCHNHHPQDREYHSHHHQNYDPSTGKGRNNMNRSAGSSGGNGGATNDCGDCVKKDPSDCTCAECVNGNCCSIVPGLGSTKKSPSVATYCPLTVQYSTCLNNNTRSNKSSSSIRYGYYNTSMNTSKRSSFTKLQFLMTILAVFVFWMYSNHRIYLAQEELKASHMEKSNILSQMEWLDTRARQNMGKQRQQLLMAQQQAAVLASLSSSSSSSVPNGEGNSNGSGGSVGDSATDSDSSAAAAAAQESYYFKQIKAMHHHIQRLEQSIQQTSREKLQQAFPTLYSSKKSPTATTADNSNSDSSKNIASSSSDLLVEMTLEGFHQPLIFKVWHRQMPYTSWTWIDQIQKGLWTNASLQQVDQSWIDIHPTISKIPSSGIRSPTSTANRLLFQEESMEEMLMMEEEHQQKHGAGGGLGLGAEPESHDNQQQYHNRDHHRFVLGMRNPQGHENMFVITIHLEVGTCEEDDNEVCFGELIGGFDGIADMDMENHVVTNVIVKG